MPYSDTALPPFEAEYCPPDTALIEAMLARGGLSPEVEARVRKRGRRYIEAIRKAPKGAGLEDFMQEYSLSTKEGLALMVLAEALLRVPDPATQDRLIEDKLGAGDWDAPDGDEGWLLMAASWGIGLSARIVRQGETPSGVLRGMVRRLGSPVVRTGTRQAMSFLGHNFVLGQTIEDALARAAKQERKGLRYSYDMLGEGARTHEDAARYTKAYEDAIKAIGERAERLGREMPDRSGISVKLSALHPRYLLKNREDVLKTLVPRLTELAIAAKQHDLGFTVDAEEADRLELSLDVFAAVAADERLAGWDGFGLAVQAYQKRSPAVISYVNDVASRLGRRFKVRLVKGAYWDTEIKRAQERGLENFPVYTRKVATDLCYHDCAKRLLAMRDNLYPQFATHNALTMATILELGGTGPEAGYEFQRLHGMGEILHDGEIKDAGVPVRVYAPVGGYKELLAYLVRRLLENAANSSFVAKVADDRISDDDLLTQPEDAIRELMDAGRPVFHPAIHVPPDLYPDRRNSRGAELGYRPDLAELSGAVAGGYVGEETVTGFVGGASLGENDLRDAVNPATGRTFARWAETSEADVARAVAVGKDAFPAWDRKGPAARASCLRAYADILEAHRDELLGVLGAEAGKTMDDGLAEVREAVDFCRYYAAEAERVMAPKDLPSPVGETNTYHLEGRGVFACIAPWNFPLAIFVGQAVAAIAAGNAVVAKPAEQTPVTAAMAVKLAHEAGIPGGIFNLVLGGGKVGAALTADERIAGVAFTGSTKTAKAIGRTLAEREGGIIPFIAETGGVNAMIVDSTALPEQVADDVISSAFRSAGQRCSALRVLYLQEDVADSMLEMIEGAARALVLGDPGEASTDVGPVIDAAARERLDAHWAKVGEEGRVVYVGEAPEEGTFYAPRIVEMPDLDSVQEEAFGPILHVIRYGSRQLDAVMEAIGSTGYGLTFGLHTRLEERIARLVPRAPAGNVYVNRNQIGAIVGVQPFGGRGLSGTGPKAGGPLYLTRFCEERTVTINTTAAGGNASLIAMGEDE
ncbi:bifunctional proline dehydrogenase/L-glutamate gamma-semialdehyde dehydrogenase PutA [Parvularcula dongshanensis]|uniref:Bifunctional protein PutA n=1 Tax=Parvularcula dongshanensis TaxID=1173995 RepID=A0A840I238_9PROT|nr:bifunctional proline dehydrogenase/L-glutamate gamma-semialdehyde dehydrogenase PutA [Parvularcula dongshanensis]MBB4658258.1 RHH-type proline utilization regulon transcriptional repressor/proline dehydrogenase/delta 1-pyrroline-5-carboxylate dehydrogenase [Parvularcula dongshanensis]